MPILNLPILCLCFLGAQSLTKKGDVNAQLGNANANQLGYNPDDVPTETALKDFSGDWLFHVRTTSCHGDAFDNGANSYISRTFLPILSICSVGLLCLSWKEKREKEVYRLDEKNEKNEGRSEGLPDSQADESSNAESQGERSQRTSQEKSKRLFHVDFARICAVMCVIFEHSGGVSYTHRNVGFGLWWALPYLYVTSGMASMMSKSSIVGYVMRLLLVFTVGTLANLFADAVTHRDWSHDFGNTIFQMFFVVMLLIMAPLAEPLRQALRQRSRSDDGPNPLTSGEEGTAWSTGWTFAFMMLWGTISCAALAFFVRGFTGDSEIERTFQDEKVSRWIQFYAPVLRHTPIILVHVGGTLFLSLLATLVCHDDNTGVVGWILLAFSYLQMIVVPWDQDSFAHLVNLNIVGMVTFQWPLAGSAMIARLVNAYWPFLLMFLCLDSMPDMWGRCDVHSPYSTWERFRMFLGEFTLVVCFIAGAFTPSDPKKVTPWLNLWSLYAYCFHVMWYRLFGSPYGAIITFASIPLFYFLLMSDKSSKPDSGTDGCGLGNREIRGPIAAGLEQNKVRKHVAVCLSHCGPPSCTLKDAETDCACLRCTMFCMSRGSYVDACLNNHTRDLCLDYQKYINSTELCEVDCDAAAGLPFSVFLTFGLLCSSFLFA
ncbi:unnamed protein product [Durusdinium trenchii]|uniref:Acyltransferase 3 domain-containing protein n=1 Tax=Durusdinium trenchii TaxID=1381693 RepID=A0ABP0KIS3_9DINO